MKFLEKWDRHLTRLSEERFYFALLVMLAIPAAFIVTSLALSIHRNFLSVACDTAVIQSAVVNTLHGNWFRDTAYDGPNLLGLHTMLVLVLVAPIYAMFPSADTLYILQIVGVYSTVIPIYLVALDILRRPLGAFLVAVAALSSPMLLHMSMAPVHPETWILASVFWSYFFYRKNRVVAFWVSFAFGLSCGEQATLVYIALGTAWLLVDDGVAWRQRYGKLALAGGFGWLILTFGVIFPLMRQPGQTNLFAYNYSDWGIHSALGLAGAMAHDPLKVFDLLHDPSRWSYVAAYVGLPLLLAFFYLRSFILLAPFPVYFLMNSHQYFLFFHAYYFQFAFFAGYLGLLFFLSRWDMATRLGATVMVITLMINVLILCHMGEFYVRFDAIGDRDQSRELSRDLHAAFEQIPTDAGVYAPHRYSAYLSNRDNMVMGDLSEEKFDFKAMVEERYGTTDVHAGQVDYIVCDVQNDQCGWRHIGLTPEVTKRRTDNINLLMKSGEWQMFWNKDDVVILKRVEK